MGGGGMGGGAAASTPTGGGPRWGGHNRGVPGLNNPAAWSRGVGPDNKMGWGSRGARAMGQAPGFGQTRVGAGVLHGIDRASNMRQSWLHGGMTGGTSRAAAAGRMAKGVGVPMLAMAGNHYLHDQFLPGETADRNLFQKTLSGASQGAAGGSIFGPVGAGVGALGTGIGELGFHGIGALLGRDTSDFSLSNVIPNAMDKLGFGSQEQAPNTAQQAFARGRIDHDRINNFAAQTGLAPERAALLAEQFDRQVALETEAMLAMGQTVNEDGSPVTESQVEQAVWANMVQQSIPMLLAEQEQEKEYYVRQQVAQSFLGEMASHYGADPKLAALIPAMHAMNQAQQSRAGIQNQIDQQFRNDVLYGPQGLGQQQQGVPGMDAQSFDELMKSLDL